MTDGAGLGERRDDDDLAQSFESHGQGMNTRRVNAVVVGDENPSHVSLSVAGCPVTAPLIEAGIK